MMFHHKYFLNPLEWILIIAVNVLAMEDLYTEPNISFINIVIILTLTFDYHQNSLYALFPSSKNFSSKFYVFKKHCLL